MSSNISFVKFIDAVNFTPVIWKADFNFSLLIFVISIPFNTSLILKKINLNIYIYIYK